jgi:hypothetical protein
MAQSSPSILATAAALRTAVRTASPDELPALIGTLAEADAIARMRLLAPGSPQGIAEPDHWITPDQAASIAGVNRRTIYDWAAGKVWASRPSRRCLRIADTAFRRWLAAR